MDNNNEYTNSYSGSDYRLVYSHGSTDALDIDMTPYALRRREQIANWIKLQQQFSRIMDASISTRRQLQYAWSTMDWNYRPIYTTKTEVPPTMSLLIAELQPIIWRSLIGRDRDFWLRTVKPYSHRYGYRTAYAELQETIHNARQEFYA